MLTAFNTGNPTAVFDVPVNESTELLVQHAVEWLEQHAMSHVGLWREQGTGRVIEQMIEQIQSGHWAGLTDNIWPPDVTGLIVRLLTKRIPGGLFSPETLDLLMSAAGLPDEAARASAFRAVLEGQNSSPQAVVRCLLTHWSKVADSAHQNTMDTKGVAICVAGALGTSCKPRNLVKLMSVVQQMLELTAHIFPETDASEPLEDSGATWSPSSTAWEGCSESVTDQADTAISRLNESLSKEVQSLPRDTALSEWNKIKTALHASNHFAAALCESYFSEDREAALQAYTAAESEWSKLRTAVCAAGRLAAAATDQLAQIEERIEESVDHEWCMLCEGVEVLSVASHEADTAAGHFAETAAAGALDSILEAGSGVEVASAVSSSMRTEARAQWQKLRSAHKGVNSFIGAMLSGYYKEDSADAWHAQSSASAVWNTLAVSVKAAGRFTAIEQELSERVILQLEAQVTAASDHHWEDLTAEVKALGAVSRQVHQAVERLAETVHVAVQEGAGEAGFSVPDDALETLQYTTKTAWFRVRPKDYVKGVIAPLLEGGQRGAPAEVQLTTSAEWSKLRSVVCAAGRLATVQQLPESEFELLAHRLSEAADDGWKQLCAEVQSSRGWFRGPEPEAARKSLEEESIGDSREELTGEFMQETAAGDTAADERPAAAVDFGMRGSRVIPLAKVIQLLSGSWRMYCKPDGDIGYSYGLIISNVQPDVSTPNKFTFDGSSQVHGRYRLEAAVATWNQQTGKVEIEYDEVWSNGNFDRLKAWLKTNGKFSCQNNSGGFVQKARKESTMPTDTDARARAPFDKYYTEDIFIHADADGDGKLSLDEWISLFGSADGFDERDVDGDGLVDASEFANKAAAAAGNAVEHDEVEFLKSPTFSSSPAAAAVQRDTSWFRGVQPTPRSRQALQNKNRERSNELDRTKAELEQVKHALSAAEESNKQRSDERSGESVREVEGTAKPSFLSSRLAGAQGRIRRRKEDVAAAAEQQHGAESQPAEQQHGAESQPADRSGGCQQLGEAAEAIPAADSPSAADDQLLKQENKIRNLESEIERLKQEQESRVEQLVRAGVAEAKQRFDRAIELRDERDELDLKTPIRNLESEIERLKQEQESRVEQLVRAGVAEAKQRFDCEMKSRDKRDTTPQPALVDAGLESMVLRRKVEELTNQFQASKAESSASQLMLLREKENSAKLDTQLEQLQAELDQSSTTISKLENLTETPRGVVTTRSPSTLRKKSTDAPSLPRPDPRPPPCPSCGRRVGHHKTCEMRETRYW